MHYSNMARIFALLCASAVFAVGCAGAPDDESEVVAETSAALTGKGCSGSNNPGLSVPQVCDASLQWVCDMFAQFDAGNIAGWANGLDPNVALKLANEPTVYGRASAQGMFVSLLPLLTSVQHQLVEVWKHPGGVTVKGNLIVTRASDGVTVSIPFTDLLTVKNHLVTEYFIYMDPAPLFE